MEGKAFEKRAGVLYEERSRKGIDDLVRASADNRHVLCLMCSELKPSECHRSKLVGEYLFKQGHKVLHITEDDSLKDQPAIMEHQRVDLEMQLVQRRAVEFEVRFANGKVRS